MENNIGDKTQPCGHPVDTVSASEISLHVFTRCDLSVKNSYTHAMILLLICLSVSLWINIELLMVLKALLKSINTAGTCRMNGRFLS